MTRNSTTLAVSAADSLAQIINLQELLEISLEQLDNATLDPETRLSRVQLLLSYYLDCTKSPLKELKVELTEILQQHVCSK